MSVTKQFRLAASQRPSTAPARSRRSWAVSLAALLAGVAATLPVATLAQRLWAHEDDPKASEKHPPVLGPAWREADGGVAMETFASSGVVLKSWFPVNTFNQQGVTNTSGNDCWGYVSPMGREYALIGLSGGTGFVEVTDPGNSQIVAFKPGPESLWRNVKTYLHYAYAVSEGGGGIQVFDLANIDNGVVTQLPSVTTGGDERTHTMIINGVTGFLYRMGGGPNGVRIYDLKPNPAAPAFVAQWQDKYTHDGFVTNYTSGPYAGKEIFFACGGLNGGFAGTGVDIIDVTNKASLAVLSNFQYPQAAFCHQAWITPDQKYIYINDEIDEQDFGLLSVGRIVDVSNLSAPFLAGTYTTGLTSVDHNLYVKGSTLLCSNYKTGLQIFDLADPTAPVRTAFFDTYPEADATGYAGLWSNYPFFPSGTVLGSDLQRGLFVWRIESPVATFEYPQGTPFYVSPAGASLDVLISPLGDNELLPETARLVINVAGGSPVDYPLEPLGKGVFRANFPLFECGTPFVYSFRIQAESGTVTTDPPGGVAAMAALGEPVILADDLEATQGWVAGVPGDTATAGKWVLVDPIGTSAQPEDDHTPAPGVKCWVTGQGTLGGQAGQSDVDGGKTTLVSPKYDLSGQADPYLTYWRWYSNNLGGNPNQDSMPVEITNNGGLTWVQLELVNQNAGAWVKKTFRVKDYVEPTANVYVRFIARDEGPGSLVEAGVDDISITSLDCPSGIPGDLDGNGTVGPSDLTILLSQWGTAGSADLDGNGVVGASDLAILLAAWS
jgi:choice-of-anchor B domain-containing protein